jgi:predicted RNA-binding Zn ribbon-like protein
MSSRLVDGLLLPDAVAGLPALELCNTRAGWADPATAKEYLLSYDHLAVWAREQGLLDPLQTARLRASARRRRSEADEVLQAALRLRQDLYPVLLGAGTRESPPAAAWAGVASAAEDAAGAARLEPTPGGASWVLGEHSGLGLPVDAVAWEAAALLVSGGAAAVAACPGGGCGWLFSDPRRRRRWCSMAVCGNRAKARAYAARRQMT